jgi:ribonuclease BN (tRNA processing enzyme)
VGYCVDNGRAALIFSGDTTVNDALWKVVNRTPNLRYLIIETAFSNKERDIAVASKHLCPRMLAEELEKMRAVARGVHHAPEARRGRAHHEGSGRGRGTVAAPDAGEQPGIRAVRRTT